MLGRQIGLLGDILKANVRANKLPFKLTFVSTYKCNFRCEMCSIWQRKSVNEMTPAEVAEFFGKWPQFRWVDVTGGEIFMRKDIEDLIDAIQEHCRSLFLLHFPTTGWFGDRAVALARQILDRGVGRLMITVSIDGPKALHEEMRGLPGSWERGIETYRRLAEIRRANFEVVAGMTLVPKNVNRVDETIAAIQSAVPGFLRSDLHVNIAHESGHYFGNEGYLATRRRAETLRAIEDHARKVREAPHPVAFIENRYRKLVGRYYETGKSPLPCSALSSSCFIDAYWNVFPCSIWDEKVGNLREAGFDFGGLWTSPRARDLRRSVEEEHCPHCWTPCEAFPTILSNLVRAVTTSAPDSETLQRAERHASHPDSADPAP